MKFNIFFLVIFFFSHPISPSVFFSLEDAFTKEQYALVIDARLHASKNKLEDYKKIILDLPGIMQESNKKMIPLIILVPSCLEHINPINEVAYFTEAARTALAWIRAYYEVIGGIIDPFIIPLQTEEIDPDDLFLLIHEKDLFCRSKVEIKNIRQRIISYNPDINLLKVPCILRPIDFSVCERNSLKKISLQLSDLNYNKRYLISGGAGMIGSHMVKRLLHEGNQVIVLDNLSSGSLDNVEPYFENPNFVFVNCDVCIPFELEAKIDGVIHCASLPSPAFYYKNPYETLLVGLQGTKNLLEIAKKNASRFLFTSTSEVYGDPEVNPQYEEYAGNVDCMGQRSAYDQSKRGAETLIKLYFDEYRLDARIARIFNTYGPGMAVDGRAVPNFMDALLEDKPLVIYGDGNQTRSFGYIDDTVNGLYLLLSISESFLSENMIDRVFNIGTPSEFTIAQLAQKFDHLSKKYFNKPMEIKKISNPDASDPRVRRPDITRAKKILGFNPLVSLDEGLEKTFLYFLKKRENTYDA